MLFELIDFLGWGWLIFFHIIAFGLLYLPFLYGTAIRFTEVVRERLDPNAK